MNDPVFYAHEKLSRVIQVLATHPGRIKERLAAAYGVVALISLGDLPDEARDLWQTRVWGPLTWVNDHPAAAAVSLHGRLEEQASSIATDIVTVNAIVEFAIRQQYR